MWRARARGRPSPRGRSPGAGGGGGGSGGARADTATSRPPSPGPRGAPFAAPPSSRPRVCAWARGCGRRRRRGGGAGPLTVGTRLASAARGHSATGAARERGKARILQASGTLCGPCPERGRGGAACGLGRRLSPAPAACAGWPPCTGRRPLGRPLRALHAPRRRQSGCGSACAARSPPSAVAAGKRASKWREFASQLQRGTRRVYRRRGGFRGFAGHAAEFIAGWKRRGRSGGVGRGEGGGGRREPAPAAQAGATGPRPSRAVAWRARARRCPRGAGRGRRPARDPPPFTLRRDSRAPRRCAAMPS